MNRPVLYCAQLDILTLYNAQRCGPRECKRRAYLERLIPGCSRVVLSPFMMTLPLSWVYTRPIATEVFRSW